MSRRDNSIILKDIWLIAAGGLLISVVLGLVSYFNVNLLYAIGDGECINVLYANGYFDSLTKGLLPANSEPFQNANLLTRSLITFSTWSFIPYRALIWLGQAMVGVYFLYRSMLLFSLIGGAVTEERICFTALLLIHPLFWITLIFHPSDALTAVLVLDYVSRIVGDKTSDITGCASLFILSLSGSAGFLWALALAVANLFIYQPLSFTKINFALRRMGYALGFIAPIGIIYAVRSFEWGILGGPCLTDYPTAFSQISIARLFDGVWSSHAIDAFSWFGNGLLYASVTVPVFGFLFLLGLSSGLGESGSKRRFSLMMAMVGAILLFFFAFTPIDVSRQWMLSFLPMGLIGVFGGLKWLSQFKPQSRTPVCIAFCVCLAFFTVLSSVKDFQNYFDRARYYQNICVAMQKELGPVMVNQHEFAAVRFDPVVLSRTPFAEHLYPVDLGWNIPFSTIFGKQGGLFFDLRFAPAPDEIILYSRYCESIKQSSAMNTLSARTWEASLDEHYSSTLLFNLKLYKRETDPVKVMSDWRLAAMEDGYHFETRHEQNWFASHFLGERQSALDFDDDVLPQPIGLKWDFEIDFSNTHQTGSAFGFAPDSAYRAIGNYGAGSGGDDAVRKMGVLESVPFTIEGDELSLYADIPSDSTASLVCLAVYCEVPFQVDGAEAQLARHIYEKETVEPLLGDVFFYINPQHLNYGPGWIRGWRVVQVYQQAQQDGWRRIEWPLDAWRGRQALWHAADRSPNHSISLDQIAQWKRPPGLYFNFEHANYDGWQSIGAAFGDKPAIGSIGGQDDIDGYEGNYFVNSYYQGSDAATGTLRSATFELEWDQISFHIGGGNDADNLYVGLRVNDKVVLRETGGQSENLRHITWDVSTWQGKTAQLEIADFSSNPWGHILVDDIQVYQKPVLHPVSNEERGRQGQDRNASSP